MNCLDSLPPCLLNLLPKDQLLQFDILANASYHQLHLSILLSLSSIVGMGTVAVIRLLPLALALVTGDKF